MDVALLAAALTQMLAPALPHLVRGGQELVEKAGEALADGAWERVKGLWERLRPRLEERPDAASAVREVALAPADPDAQAALRLQLRKLLAEDESLAAELARLAGRPEGGFFAAQVQGSGAVAQGKGAVAAGAGGVAVGGDLHGGIVLGAGGGRPGGEAGGQGPEKKKD